MQKSFEMNEKTKKAKEILENEQLCLVLISENEMFKSAQRGIKPILNAIENNMSDCFAADKIVGKASALLYVLMGAKEVFAKVMSKTALKVFNDNNISCFYETLTDVIINRTNTGMCPMEETVININNPLDAKKALIKKVQEMKTF